MKTAKQFLALLLSAILLFSFGVGANAVTPEDMTPEELEAYGRALLMQTMEDLRGDYTLTGELFVGLRFHTICYDYGKVFHSNGKYTFLRYEGHFWNWYDRDWSTAEWFISYHDIVADNEIVRIYPDQNAYRKLNSSPSIDYISMLEPKPIPESTPIQIFGPYDSDDGRSVGVLFDGHLYCYWNNSLTSIENTEKFIRVEDFDKAVSQNIFSSSGYRRTSTLQAWWWENAQAVQEYFSKSSWPPYWMPFLPYWIVFLPLQTISFAFNRPFDR